MVRTVRVPARAMKELRLGEHYRRYRTVLPNDGTTFVPGEGDVMSKVVIIGEAPGEEEERLGKPFIGKSGNLLSKVLKTVGLSREQVFITNLVKHRPPDNADPTLAQAASARVLMQWEVNILKPKVIVPLGRFATEIFYPSPKMQVLSGTCRRKYVEGEWYWVTPQYHPSAALRHASVRETLFEHFQSVKQALEM